MTPSSVGPLIDASDLEALTRDDGPFATVVVGTPPVAGAEANPSASLRAQGAPQAVCDAIQPFLTDVASEAPGVLVVANGHGVLHIETIGTPPARDLARWDALPSLVPLIAEREARTPYVLGFVTPGRTEIAVFADRVPHVEIASGTGGGTPVVDVSSGWGQATVVRRSDADLPTAMSAVADELRRRAEENGAASVIVMADDASAALLADRLADDSDVDDARVLAVTSGTPIEELLRRVEGELDAMRATARITRARELRDAVSRDAAVQGVSPVIDALNRRDVETLVVADDWADDRRVRLEPGTGRLLDASFVGGPAHDARLVDACVWSALNQGCGVMTVPSGGIAEDLGAVLA